MTRKKTIILLAAAALTLSLASTEQANASSYQRRVIRYQTRRNTRRTQTGNSSTNQNTGSRDTFTDLRGSSNLDNFINNSGSVELQPSGNIEYYDNMIKTSRTDPRMYNPYRYPHNPYRFINRIAYVNPDAWTNGLWGISEEVREQIRPLARKMDETYYEAIAIYIDPASWGGEVIGDPRFYTLIEESNNYKQQIQRILLDNNALDGNPVTLTQ